MTHSPDDKQDTSNSETSAKDDDGTRTRTRTRKRDDSDSTSGETRSRSRRSRSRGGSSRGGSSNGKDGSGASDKEESKGSASGDDSSSNDSGNDDKDGKGGSRRRRGRRGRRGRGRGKGGDSSQSKDTSKDSSGRGSDKGSSKDGGKGGSSKADSGKGGSSKGDSGKGDDDVKDAIAKSGTRVTAKRGGGGSSRGGGSRSGRGGGSRGGRGGGGRHQRPTGVPEEVRRAILDGPPRTMLVSSTEARTQIAVLEDRTVVEHHVTRKEDVTYVGNIYMARVQNVLPGMEAAFLDIGKGRNGVLYAGEVLYDELDVEEGIENPRIEDALKQGQKVLVQVTKDPMGSKGPRLTMHLSLAGRYMVLAPNSDLFGISRKLTDKERDRLRRIVKKVKPDHHGVIVRTAAENATEEQLTADLERLLKKWEKAEKKAENAKALTPVYEEPPLVVKVIRDNFGPEFERCVVDSPDLYGQVCEYLEEVAPELLDKVELYGAKKTAAPEAETKPESEDTGDDDATAASTGDADPTSDEADAKDDAKAGSEDAAEASKKDEGAGERTIPEVDTTDLKPLFDAYHVNEQLRKAMGRKVWLPSGGYLIIETTEAMKVIDVNTGKFTGDAKSNLEEVVLKTNLEAAEEIVRQLRLRDLGGIIVIDFIDMLLKANQDQVVRKLKRELLRDRTKTRVSEVSKLGLVQMTRKNVSQGLVEAFSHKCESCEGHGYINELED